MDREIVFDALDVIRVDDPKDLCRIPVAGDYILNNNEIIAKQFEYETIPATDLIRIASTLKMCGASNGRIGANGRIPDKLL